MIHWELCKKLKFDHTNKCYMHNPESVPENEAHKLHWDFDAQADPQVTARLSGPIKKKKKNNDKKERTCRIVDLAVLAEQRIELKECEKRDKYLDLARKLKKPWNMKVTIIPIVIGTLGSQQRIGTKTGGLGNKGIVGYCPNDNFVEISQNTAESP